MVLKRIILIGLTVQRRSWKILKKLTAMIMDHYTVQCPRLAALDDYMKARNNGIYDDDSRRIEKVAQIIG
mgnify:CR=1 FL=1